jgi:hypothetical protein
LTPVLSKSERWPFSPYTLFSFYFLFLEVLIKHAHFSRVDVDLQKNNFERILTEQMETMSLNQVLEVTYSVSLASIYMLKSISKLFYC